MKVVGQFRQIKFYKSVLMVKNNTMWSWVLLGLALLVIIFLLTGSGCAVWGGADYSMSPATMRALKASSAAKAAKKAETVPKPAPLPGRSSVQRDMSRPPLAQF